jgi:hypothetical protein
MRLLESPYQHYLKQAGGSWKNQPSLQKNVPLQTIIAEWGRRLCHPVAYVKTLNTKNIYHTLEQHQTWPQYSMLAPRS